MGTTEIISLLGIGGTLVGTLGGVGLSYAIERRKWRREDRTRFHPDRYPKYVEFLQAASQALFANLESEEEYSSADAMWDAEAGIDMIATRPVREAARAYAASVMDEKFGSGKGGDFSSNMHEIDEERRAFVEAAREELGIPID